MNKHSPRLYQPQFRKDERQDERPFQQSMRKIQATGNCCERKQWGCYHRHEQWLHSLNLERKNFGIGSLG